MPALYAERWLIVTHLISHFISLRKKRGRFLAGIVVLCALVSAARPLRSETADRRVAEWVLVMGGVVETSGAARRADSADQLPAGEFRLAVIDLVGTNVYPPDLKRLAELEYLRELYLPGPIWNRNADGGKDLSRDLRHIAGIASLEKLSFSYHFLDNIRFSDTGLEEIGDLWNLKELTLRQTAVRGHSLASFRRLEALDVTLSRFDDEGMRNLAGATELRRLRLGDTLVTDAGLAHLGKLRKLEELDLHGTQISEAGIARLRHLSEMRKLNLMGVGLSDEGLAHLAGMRKLEVLNLYRAKISNAGLERLQQFRHLREARSALHPDDAGRDRASARGPARHARGFRRCIAASAGRDEQDRGAPAGR